MLCNLKSSNNGKYFIGVDWSVEQKNKNRIQSFDSATLQKISDFMVVIDIGGRRQAISNDGKYIASAAYERYGIFLYNAQTGEQIWNCKSVKGTHVIQFSLDDNYIIASSEDSHTYFINIQTGNVENRIVATKIYLNPYGENIPLWHRDTVKMNGKKIQSPTFTFSSGLCLSNGIALSAISNDLFFYNYDGDLLWREGVNHSRQLAQIAYNKSFNCIVGTGKIEDKSGKISDILYYIDITNGKTISEYPVQLCQSYAFINETSQLICDNGILYNLYENHIDPTAKIDF